MSAQIITDWWDYSLEHTEAWYFYYGWKRGCTIDASVLDN